MVNISWYVYIYFPWFMNQLTSGGHHLVGIRQVFRWDRTSVLMNPTLHWWMIDDDLIGVGWWTENMGKKHGNMGNEHGKKHMGMGQYLLIPFLVGWTSMYQLFWGSLGTRVLTHSHISGWWWLEHGLYFPCHTWDVIRNPLTNSMIFQRGR